VVPAAAVLESIFASACWKHNIRLFPDLAATIERGVTKANIGLGKARCAAMVDTKRGWRLSRPWE
jgi:hypothetical protein